MLIVRKSVLGEPEPCEARKSALLVEEGWT